ncbi:CTL-like protein DDB_G0274487 [Herrania umbratica]|uniref:Choline transporter-like protein n=1 Tax=Herrania umbratica TaxID=108875 RepID=A0A6J1BNP0_9ROSI|nr:CTL-like protein DDB_G0274487 [Herrania umbratica]
MSDSNVSSSSSDSASTATVDRNVGRSQRIIDGGQTFSPELRHWRDVFWLAIFIIHLIGLGFVLAVLGLNRFKKLDRLNIDRYTNRVWENNNGLTENYWPKYAVAGGVGTALGWTWLLLLGSRANQMMKVSVHILTTYLAVISVLCFWCEQFFWGVAFATGAALQFLYVISVIDRLPFTMLVLQKAVKMVWSLPEVMRVAYAFMVVMLLWMGIWSFGAAGVVASSRGDLGRWWLLVVLSVSLFWTGAVLCNTVHVIVSGLVFLILIHGGRNASSMPSNSLMKSLRYAVTTSFGSICYGSLFTAAIRTLRWEIRGFRSKIGNNECLLCCVDFLFQLVETLVRFFNKYAYVQIAIHGKGFNRSARDAWELFQSTGVEALVAYDCSGAVLLMGTVLGGLITGTCAGVWTWINWRDRVIMVGSTAMLMGMVLVGLAMVVVESAVTSIYVCYAEDPSLIQRWDPQFFNQMSETLHHRLQHRSARAREVLSHSQLDGHMQDTYPL